MAVIRLRRRSKHITGRRVVPFSRTRLLDMLPGGLAWGALGVTIWSAYAAPSALLWGAAVLALYTALRFGLAAIAAGWGLHRIRQWEALDWQAEYDRLAGHDSLPLEVVHHLVLVPNYGEDINILRRTLTQLAQQHNARHAITVVLAMEAAEDGARSKSEQLRAEFAASFAHILVTFHPPHIPGEQQCKSANLAWAVKQARRVMIDDLSYEVEHVLVTAMDADTIWHPDHFEGLTVLFATDPQRYRTYWQAPIRYHGNVWSMHPWMRLLHAYSSTWELAYLAAPWWRALPMSSYALSLRLLDRTGYWDSDVIADEWHIFIKSHFHHDGDQRLQPVFLPFLANAAIGSTLWQTIIARYLQTFRHAWGAKEIGYALDQLLQQPRIAGWSTLGLILRVAHDNILAGAGWIILFLGAQLPVLLHPTWSQNRVTSPAFLLLQTAFGAMTILTLVFWALDVRLRPPQPEAWTLRARVAEALSPALIAILTVFCVALPVLHAQTWLMMGKSIRFRVTAKL